MSEELRVTNLDEIKKVAKQLLDVVKIEPSEKFPIICNHPYTNTTLVLSQGHRLDLTNKEDYLVWREDVYRIIDRCQKIKDFLMILNTAYYLTFLKFSKNYMSLEDFSSTLGEAWVMEENPNGDVNVSINTSVSWFREADKKKLMTSNDYKKWNSFDKGLVVYRGVAAGRVTNGLSWTTSIESAEWFAHRYDTAEETGYIQKLVVSDKRNILCYFSTRGEEEVIIDIFKEGSFEVINE